MFSKDTYLQRRHRLRQSPAFACRQTGAGADLGVILLLGNQDCPINFADNPYPFRQDSSFLYFFGLDKPGLAGLIDVDEGAETVFGDDPTIDQVVWTGPQVSLHEMCQRVGILKTGPSCELAHAIEKAQKLGRTIHFLPQYRPENIVKISQLLHIEPSKVQDDASEALIRAIVAQRSIKESSEVEQIETALEITREMQIAAMEHAKPGIYERDIAGIMEGIAVSRGVRLAFPTIFSIHGETLHNHSHDNLMREGDIAVNDSGAESPLHYASDITRTIPIGGRFSSQQREIYQIVLKAHQRSIAAIKPGVQFRQVHRLACETIAAGLADLGLIKKSSQVAVEAGAHTLFFQCGIGHMLGLDVHDMESLGEDYVGYTNEIKRKMEFGWQWLRLAKALESGYVVTVEPGIYFIPQLIDRWHAQHRFPDFIDYEKVEKYRLFGGIRIEDDVLVTPVSSVEDRNGGCRILGPNIPRLIEEVEAFTAK